MSVTPEEARRELAKRELERRRSQQGAEAPEQSGLDRFLDATRSPSGTNILEGAIGAGDVALSAGRSLLGDVLGGFAALPGIGRPDVKTEQGTVSAPEYIFNSRPFNAIRGEGPMTGPGERLMGRIAPVMETVDTALTDAFDVVPGPPEVKAGAKTAVLGPLELLGIKGVGRGARSFVAEPVQPGGIIPSIQDLYGVSRTAFNEARIHGGSVRPEALARSLERITQLKNNVGLKIDFDPDLHPKATKVQQRIIAEFESGNVDFDNLLTLRELAGEVAGDIDKAEAFRGVLLKQQLDDFVDSLTPDDVLAGDPQRAAEALSFARQTWRDASAARTIEKQINLAEIDAGDTTGMGFENKLRIRFRQLARRIEQGYEKGFKPDEIAAIRRVAEGGPVENLFRYLGKFSINQPIYAAIGGGLAGMVGGPAAGGALVGAATLSRKVAEQLGKRNVQNAYELPLRNSLIE